METIYLTHPIQYDRHENPPTVMALGYFDGVHLGHRTVIETAVKIAKEKGAVSAVMTFHPHPKEVLRKPSEPMYYITPLEDKITEIETLGVDKLFVVTFNEIFASLTPQQFVDEYLLSLHTIHVVAGFDFTYGQLGKGTMETLPFHARNLFSQTTVAKVEEHGTKISSTHIRQLLDEGRVEEISQFLGRDYEVKGKVVHGEKRGRTIGFPTANVAPIARYMIPATGVYVVEAVLDGRTLQGVCNVGYKPTFHDSTCHGRTIEVHLFDFASHIYERGLTVRWKKRIRSEQKFASLEDLKKQIQQDTETAKAYFNQ
ncbi:bifunctional riboflavin kinase/FAD synthetase [Halalkalibacterium halodurans]|uniref:bifunctional riboflavin kinase/FAD synthetase n=1 Tax=Halalkalibacterium halodurans TaxID=86665 RepID=UPI002E1ABB82|nr:bifunctional riboflavin kinase/FAD synthetase [Halalkalibacterium halodurans]MED4086841.1 bifunctional riboflavin kinase/FAD synthetase [Halalkalibacterium halodurans]MED4104247.1 bifunctional riboflavin kinase/FAD synthetase [Halalkalibacterium halodurans]MED4110395.1 bifunctional riboflavin kinase/FAD synthetase [Halalkalibacterium halodurans]MED4150478.1 bifunctional riboflavin kinase/FAD synthetase [Halalkalibacterium halodurans]